MSEKNIVQASCPPELRKTGDNVSLSFNSGFVVMAAKQPNDINKPKNEVIENGTISE